MNRMIEVGLAGAEFIAVNTDAQGFCSCPMPKRSYRSRTDARPVPARRGILLSVARPPRITLTRLPPRFEGADMVFVTAGEVWRHRDGAAPVVARVASRGRR